MNGSNNIKTGFVSVTLLNGNSRQVFIRDYSPATLEARTMLDGSFVTAQWNGQKWVQVNK